MEGKEEKYIKPVINHPKGRMEGNDIDQEKGKKTTKNERIIETETYFNPC